MLNPIAKKLTIADVHHSLNVLDEMLAKRTDPDVAENIAYIVNTIRNDLVELGLGEPKV